jgi:S-adenosylmethionine:tRNA ribosyltransferase-isomerase
MNVSNFSFHLPEELIAQEPPEQRGASRMLVLDRASGAWQDRWFRELPEFLLPGDLLVMNDSRVVPARLLGRRVLGDGSLGTGKVEALLVEQHENGEWTALVRPGKLLREGQRMVFGCDAVLEAEVISCGEFGERRIRFNPREDFWERLERWGHVPLPPYIRREDSTADRERYQTVVARERGSVAAPTAGLHFTAAMLERVRAGGVQIETITLHVGLGTFQPVRVEKVEEHQMHAERYSLGESAATALRAAQSEGRRVIAVGTTVARTLEHCARMRHGLEPHTGRTDIFLYPGCAERGESEFRLVQGLLTNFHLPQSTLLMLVSAFAGRERVLAAYAHAVKERYRFFSYGDCMFLS